MTTRIPLPVPGETDGIAATLMARRSVREYTGESVSLPEVARLCWAGQGINHSSGKRTAPSPHGLHPLQLHLVAGEVEDTTPGLYRYLPRAHALDAVGTGDLRLELYDAALEDQPWVRSCAALIVISGDVEGTEAEFREQPPDGRRGRRYIHMEAGAAAQNIALQAAEMQLGSVLVGGFDDERVKALLNVEGRPLALLPVGRTAA